MLERDLRLYRWQATKIALYRKAFLFGEKNMQIKLSKIQINANRRALRDVTELAKSIQEIGLLNPITVTRDYRLIAGLHRLEACRMLGMETIAATVIDLDDLRAELAEIDENLQRNQLTVLEQSQQLARRKRVYEALYPETKAKVAGGKARQGTASENISFAENTANAIGHTERSVQYKVQIAQKIDPDVQAMIKDTPLANHQSDLLAIARMEPQDQKALFSDEETKAALLSGKMSRNEAYKKVAAKKRQKAMESKIEEAATRNDPLPVNLLHGDMLEIQLDQSFNCIIADPPYNVTPWEWDKLGDRQQFIDLTAQWLARCQSLLIPDYTLFWFCSPSYMADLEFLMRDLQLPIQSRLVWHRRNMAKGSDAKFKYLDSWECIFHISNRQVNFDPKWNDERFDLQTFAVPQTNFADEKLHPTQKPLELIRWLVRTGSFPGDHILDPFAGSGTTGHACLLENRSCTLIEREKEYIDAIQYRLSTKV